VLADDVVEGLLRVEHHRPQLAIADVDAGLLEEGRVHLSLHIAQLRQAERVRESPRGVDRQDSDLEPARSHAGCNRRGGGCLANATRSGADADAPCGE
jgi:hypothetical protein